MVRKHKHKHNQKGGSTKVMHPLVYTYTNGARNAREQASMIEQQNAEQQYNLVHGHKQTGGADCTGGPVPQPPTYGVAQGPGHMNSLSQSMGGYNNTCQNIENRALDGSDGILPPPIKGGAKKKKTNTKKRTTHKRKTTRKSKKYRKKKRKTRRHK